MVLSCVPSRSRLAAGLAVLLAVVAAGPLPASADPDVAAQVAAAVDGRFGPVGSALPALSADAADHVEAVSGVDLASVAGDPSVHLDADGMVFVVDPPPSAPVPHRTDPAGPAAADLSGPFDPDDAFTLHSRAGSDRTIYLDFDGHVTSGTAWNAYLGGQDPIVSGPFTVDGDAATFSVEERARVVQVWQRVAADFAAFDVDVTTEEPDPATLERADGNDTVFGTRLVVTPDNPFCSCGGIAYVGVFDAVGSHYQPAFVFTNSST